MLKIENKIELIKGYNRLRLSFFSLSFIFLLFSINVFAKYKVIYGDDSRTLVQDLYNPNISQIGDSIAAMVPKKLELAKDGVHYVMANSLEDSMKVCKGERFSKLPSMAYCTGFLVGDKYLVTAGHCVPSKISCKNSKWIFDYNQTSAPFNLLVFKDEQVFNCKKVIKTVLNDKTREDYAIIELDRVVSGRQPLKVNKKLFKDLNQELFVLGYPSGLPLTYTDDGFAKTHNKVFFVANLDTFGGNSGSPVFDVKTSTVQGILVRGSKDYIFSKKDRCFKVNQCKFGEKYCRGEEVSQIAPIAKILKHLNEN